MTEGRCEDTTESSLRGVLTVHSYWVGAQMLWQVNYRIRMSGRGTGWIRSHKSTPWYVCIRFMYVFGVLIGVLIWVLMGVLMCHWSSHEGTSGHKRARLDLWASPRNLVDWVLENSFVKLILVCARWEKLCERDYSFHNYIRFSNPDDFGLRQRSAWMLVLSWDCKS